MEFNKKVKTAALLTGFLTGTFALTAQANNQVISGTIYKQATGTTFDVWRINMQTAGTLTFNVSAYEASQSNVATAGYSTSDINGDGELTWLDPDTYFYKDDGHLDATDALVRCDDINNNCSIYQNGLTALTSPVTTTSLNQAEGAADGSVHFRRDPAFTATLAAGNYLFLVADYLLSPAEAAGGINTNDSFSAPGGGFVNPITDHADYRVTITSSNLNLAVSGSNIAVSSVPVPGAVWLFGSAIAGGIGLRRKKSA